MSALSREQAVKLSAEFAELAIKFRCLEAKYGCDAGDDGHSLGASALRALRPYALDPEVAANASKAGFVIEHLPIEPLALPDTNLPLAGFSRQNSSDSTQLCSVEYTGSAFDEPSPAWTKQVSGTSLASASTAQPHSRQSTPNVEPADERHRTDAPSDCQRELSGWPQMQRFRFVPGSHSTRRQEKFSFLVEHQVGCTARELRRKLCARLKLPLGKLWLLTSPEHLAASDSRSESDARDCFILSDEEPASRCVRLCIANVATVNAPGGMRTAAAALSHGRMLELQTELLTGFRAASGGAACGSRTVASVQAQVLPRYGFSPDAAGAAAMLKAFDELLTDAQVLRVGEEISELLGTQPQSFAIEIELLGQ